MKFLNYFILIIAVITFHNCTPLVEDITPSNNPLMFDKKTFTLIDGQNKSTFLSFGYNHTLDLTGDPENRKGDFVQILIYEITNTKTFPTGEFNLDIEDVSGYIIPKGGGLFDIDPFETGNFKVTKDNTNYTFTFNIIAVSGKKLNGTVSLPVKNL